MSETDSVVDRYHLPGQRFEVMAEIDKAILDLKSAKCWFGSSNSTECYRYIKDAENRLDRLWESLRYATATKEDTVE